MNKIKTFFNSIEEKFVFPVSRRTWQVMSLLAIVLLILSILFFVINSTPTTRAKISVSKEEVTENKVDTTKRSTTVVKACSNNEVNAYTDSLRGITPNSEWINLGDSSEKFLEYLTNDYGYYVTDDYGNYVIVEKRVFRPNEMAVPNMIEKIYKQRGIDTSAVCERLDVMKSIYLLSKNTSNDFLEPDGIKGYAYILSHNILVNEEQISRTFAFKEKLEGASNKISDINNLEQYLKYLEYLSDNKIDDEKIAIATELIASHKKLTNKSKFSNSEYFELAKIIFETRLSNEELKQAILDFQDDLAFYDEKGIDKSLRRYMRLYNEKLSIAEAEKIKKEAEKSAKKSKSITYAIYAFVSIVGIATILLLFSIQSILKKHFQDKKD
jgi:hypothetical protein